MTFSPDPAEGTIRWTIWQAMPMDRWMSGRQIKDLLPDDLVPTVSFAQHMHFLVGHEVAEERQFDSNEFVWRRIR